MKRITLIRDNHSGGQTLGQLFLYENDRLIFSCETLELPWRNNERQVSCIPLGAYKVIHRTSAKYKHHLHVLDVPNRTWILIHPANYVSQLMGCIAVGRHRVDINGDGKIDINHSVDTMKKLMDHSDPEMILTIKLKE